MTRDEVVQAILGADSLDDIVRARRARAAFLRRHPDDYEMAEYGGFLSLLEDSMRAVGEVVGNAAQ